MRPLQRIPQLSVISIAFLFVELLLIRLIGTEVRIFAYISNLVLLTVFIGSGMGMFIRKRISLTVSIAGMTLLMVLLGTKAFSNITSFVAPISDSYIWTFGLPTPTMLRVFLGITEILFLLLTITVIFIPIGQLVSVLMNSSRRPVSLYVLHTACSVIGIWFFYALSQASVSPYTSLVIGQLLLLAIMPKRELMIPALLTGATLFLVFVVSPNTATLWTPYQKLSVAPSPDDSTSHKYTISVNDVGFMVLDDLSKRSKDRSVQNAAIRYQIPRDEATLLDSYALPYLMKPDAKDVLIIGAGGGNDAAAAIRASVPHIDAVEIDPGIVRLGTLLHPEMPYSNSRVRVTVDDGRSFIKKTKGRYDIIVLAFADSHTTNSTVTNIQLDNYLYTEESFRDIKKILKPDGILFLSFAVPRFWIGGHIQQTLTSAFDQRPTEFTFDKDVACIAGCDGTFFIEPMNAETLLRDIARTPGLSKFIDDRNIDFGADADILRDDWPYLYLQDKRIPNLHITIAFLLLIIFLLLGKTTSVFSKMHWISFCLGAAFLLYEFQNISKTSLIFGNTWTVNVFSITATILMGLLAYVTSGKISAPSRISYGGLFLSLLLALVVPLSSYNGLSFGWRLAIASIALYIPVFFSGLIFIEKFSQAKDKRTFLGSSFVGSFFGGLASLLAFAFGLHTLIIVCMLLYGLSLLREYGSA